jgi:hypothetical protein
MKAIDTAAFDQVEWLLANGADVTMRDEAGASALDRARSLGFVTLSDLLTRAEAKR